MAYKRYCRVPGKFLFGRTYALSTLLSRLVCIWPPERCVVRTSTILDRYVAYFLAFTRHTPGLRPCGTSIVPARCARVLHITTPSSNVSWQSWSETLILCPRDSSSIRIRIPIAAPYECLTTPLRILLFCTRRAKGSRTHPE